MSGSTSGLPVSAEARTVVLDTIRHLGRLLAGDDAPCKAVSVDGDAWPPPKRRRLVGDGPARRGAAPAAAAPALDTAAPHDDAPGALRRLPPPVLELSLSWLRAADFAALACAARACAAAPVLCGPRAACRAQFTDRPAPQLGGGDDNGSPWRGALVPLVVLEDARAAAAAWRTLDGALGAELAFEDRDFSRFVALRWPAARPPRCSAEISVLAAVLSLWGDAPEAKLADEKVSKRVTRLLVSVASDPSRRAPKTKRSERLFKPRLHSVIFDAGAPELFTHVALRPNASAATLQGLLQMCRSIYFAFEFCSNESHDYKRRWNAMLCVLFSRSIAAVDALPPASTQRRAQLQRAFGAADLNVIFPDAELSSLVRVGSGFWAPGMLLATFAPPLRSAGVLADCLVAVCRADAPGPVADLLITLAALSRPFALALVEVGALAHLDRATSGDDDDTPLAVSEMRKKLSRAILDAIGGPGDADADAKRLQRRAWNRRVDQ
ncbi:hypothetical protein M885DRAFT_534535 [Pelagophyceae sp. CCMP2097]|nr:hypothetical protein M885DRAFT_534535 [Pelagophyceae sp. CCMP2097]